MVFCAVLAVCGAGRLRVSSGGGLPPFLCAMCSRSGGAGLTTVGGEGEPPPPPSGPRFHSGKK